MTKRPTSIGSVEPDAMVSENFMLIRFVPTSVSIPIKVLLRFRAQKAKFSPAGSFGISISIATEGKESDCLKKITDESNVALQYIGTLKDFRHILTVTNEPVASVENAIVNQVKYPAAELTPEDGPQTPLTPLSSGSNCSSRPESRSSSRGPSRKSSLRRKQAIRNFVTQSEPCTPFR